MVIKFLNIAHRSPHEIIGVLIVPIQRTKTDFIKIMAYFANEYHLKLIKVI